jgi:hypothetical protein
MKMIKYTTKGDGNSKFCDKKCKHTGVGIGSNYCVHTCEHCGSFDTVAMTVGCKADDKGEK